MSVIIPNEIKNKPLFEFFSEINMEKYYSIVLMNGYVDIKLLIR